MDAVVRDAPFRAERGTRALLRRTAGEEERGPLCTGSDPRRTSLYRQLHPALLGLLLLTQFQPQRVVLHLRLTAAGVEGQVCGHRGSAAEDGGQSLGHIRLSAY